MRNFEASRGFCPFPRNFYVFAEFRGILYWPQIKGQNGVFWPGLRSRRKLITACRHDCAMKYMTVTWALTWGILKIQSNPIQLFKSGNKAHTDTHYTIYTVEIKPKVKPTEPNKTHINIRQGNTKLRQAGRRQVRSLLPVCHIDVFMFSCIGLPIRLYLSHYI